ncbi:MAG: histidine kinase [Chitinophagaceae bacterium]|nr:histidine kinase [Chitinophagaceae bacterium]
MNFYFFIFFTLLSTIGNSQPKTHDRIGYVSQMSVFVESDLHLNDEIIYNPHDSIIWIKFPLLSPSIRMGTSFEAHTYSIIHRIDYLVGVKKISLQEVDYKIEGKGTVNTRWRKLKLNVNYNEKNQANYFIDTSLNEGQVLIISFKKPGGKVFQVFEFERRKNLPSVELFREVGDNDTTKGSLRSAIVKEKKYRDGFNELNDKLIQVDPSRYLELVFTNLSVNEDSSILYRLNTVHDSSAWQRTGHFTLLRNLKSNKTYFFKVKYVGSNSINEYVIKVSAHWYETILAITSFVAFALVVALSIFFIQMRVQWSNEKRKIEQVRYRLKAVQAQLNPHFIFNALSSIQSLVNNNDKQQANQYLARFSTVLRGALKNSEVIFIPLAEEVELLKDYLEIEQLRFQFSFNFAIDTAINLVDVEIPPMIFQPSIENAIKHGICGMGNKGVIDIQINKQAQGFLVTIFDNGHWQNKANGNGFGISLTKERIAVINEICNERQIQYKIDITENGTIAYFYFKNWFT